MKRVKNRILMSAIFAALLLSPACGLASNEMEESPSETSSAPPAKLAPPIEKNGWIVPAPGAASEPIWGVKGGIAVGLWPTPGPRGLLRIYTPYLGQPRLRMINFIAIEPIVGKARGLSELEHSNWDRMAGKALWTGDVRDPKTELAKPWHPAPGRISTLDGSRTLTFFIFVEPFKNGARPVIQVTLRQDRPHEVGFTVWSARDSAAMKACVLTATMGNYARLRQLWLKDKVVQAATLWNPFQPDTWGFAAPRTFGLEHLLVLRGEALVAATPGEVGSDTGTEKVPSAWRYEGRIATQYWRATPVPGLCVRINGRTTFWATKASIPGGVSYENFELEAPFRAGQQFHFGVAPELPERLGFKHSR
ncbi:MAG TPA: hypothetical protein VG099_06535 [Gemmataceae bacterium]|jgi:hypothetical protein|nr:hypothetical protein [Gemmataceae bacterium]